MGSHKGQTPNIISSSGYTLIELMISFALLGFVSVGILALLHHASQSKVALNQNRVEREIAKYIQTQLANNAICDNTFRGLAVNGTAQSFTNLKDKTGTALTVIQAGNYYSYNPKDGIKTSSSTTSSVRLVSMKLTAYDSGTIMPQYYYRNTVSDAATLTATASLAYGKLALEFQKSSIHIGPKTNTIYQSYRLIRHATTGLVIACNNTVDYYLASCTAIGGSYNRDNGICEKLYVDLCFGGTCQTKWPEVKISGSCTWKAACASNESAIAFATATTQLLCCLTDSVQNGAP